MNKRELYYQRLISCGLGVIFLQIREINDVKINFCYYICNSELDRSNNE